MTGRERQIKSVRLRKQTLEAIYEAGAGHPADILAEAFGNYWLGSASSREGRELKVEKQL